MGVISTTEGEPRRLAEAEDRAGRLIREANAACLAGLAPDLAWNRFQSQRQKRALIRFTLLAAALGLCVSFGRHQWLSVMNRNAAAPALVAEPVAALAPQPVDPEGLQRRVAPVPSPLPAPRLPGRTVASVGPPRSEPVLEPVTEATCRGWVNQGQAQRAVECFRSVARGSGLGAEVALYEAARLTADSLHDAARALDLLAEHQQRFPSSALRIEVEWLRVRSLEHVGRLDEALTASEALLDSAGGRALAPQLHLLRGRIYESARHDCARAVREYVALLGEPGRAGDDAEFQRAACLEQLQRPDEARVAYQRYLERADARHGEPARARLAVLAPSASPAAKEQP